MAACASSHYNVCVIYAVFLVVGMLSTFRSLPFALALGVPPGLLHRHRAARDRPFRDQRPGAGPAPGARGSQRRLGRGPVLLPGGVILAGPWYLTWLTSFVGLALVFLYGMLYGLVYRRWTLLGLVVFACAQVAAALAVVFVISHARAWTSVGHFFTGISAAGLTGLLAALTVVLLAAGFATARRVTV